LKDLILEDNVFITTGIQLHRNLKKVDQLMLVTLMNITEFEDRIKDEHIKPTKEFRVMT
jgi:hypothetical protein